LLQKEEFQGVLKSELCFSLMINKETLDIIMPNKSQMIDFIIGLN